MEKLKQNAKVKKVALWIKEYAHPLRKLGAVFFILTLLSGFIWILGANIESIAFVFSLISCLLLASPSIAQYILPDRKPVRDMNYDEILEFILTTNPIYDWVRITKKWSSEAFLKEDPRLRFRAKFIDDGVQNDDFIEPWANLHSDPNAVGYWYDLYFDGNLIDRFILVSVYGGRAEIPPPDLQSGKIKPLNYRVAQIHDTNHTLDEYIRRSGLHVE